MMNWPLLTRPRATNIQHLERWLGADKVNELSLNMRGRNPDSRWYGPPIGVANVPGEVFVTPDGDFFGECRYGAEATIMDYLEQFNRRVRRAARIATSHKRQILNTGFASLSDLISEATTGGKRQELAFLKSGPTCVSNATSTLWRVGSLPQSGGAGSAAPGGRACTSSTTGAFSQLQNPSGADTLHFVSAFPIASVNQQTLLLYDRLFDVAKTMSSTASETVTGVPTRYTSTTSTDQDYVGGNFLFLETVAQLGATAHNWTPILYTDQDGSSSTAPSLTGNSTCIIDRLDQPTGQWFVPLEAGDVGIKALTNMKCSASVTGTLNFCIGHPIVWMPCPVAGGCFPVDGINTAFSLTRIFSNACLSLLQVVAPTTTATTFTGTIVLCSG